jgi:hypothetical protein
MLRFRHLRDDERGMSLVFVGVGFMAFLSATTLAIDVGMFMTARSQAQNAADAGALAGAVAFVKNSYADRSPGGPAVQSAINTATGNDVIHGAPTVTPADVTFPLSPGGQDNRVQVIVHRPSMPTLFGQFFGVPTVNIEATAVAEASPANVMTCVKPFMIPDKWIEKQTPAWDPDDEYNKYDNKNNLLANPDIYSNKGDTRTGYTYTNDIGLELILRAGSGNADSPSFYYSWKMPGDTGGDFYRDNIANCNKSKIVRGTKIIQEPGNMMGPTIEGIEMLIAKDPDATWDTSCNCVKNSKYTGQSPRLFPIPLYDPQFSADEQKKNNGRSAEFVIANFMGFFVTKVAGNQIYGRVANITGMVDDGYEQAPNDSLTWAIRLVQ